MKYSEALRITLSVAVVLPSMTPSQKYTVHIADTSVRGA